MTERPPPVPVCPICGRSVSADARRCNYCLADLNSHPVTAGEAPPAEERRLWDGSDWSALDTRSRRVELVQRVVMLVVAGWFLYARFFSGPDTLPAVVTPSITVASGTGAWPIVGGDLGASRATAAPAHLDGDIAWEARLGNLSVPIIAGEGAVYAALTTGRLVALDTERGEPIWTHDFDYELRFAAPTLAGDRLYLVQRDGRVNAMNASDGSLILETKMDGAFAAAPVVADGMIYAYYGVGEADRSFTAPVVGIDAETGKLLWQQRVSTLFPLIPPVVDSAYLALVADTRVLIFDRATGKQTYWYPFSRFARPTSLSLVDGTVYAATPRQVVAIDVRTTEPWHYSIRGAWLQFWAWGLAPRPPAPQAVWVASTPPADALPLVVLSDRLIVAGAGGQVRALSRATGEALWDVEVGPIDGNPIATADGVLLIQGASLILIDSASGDELGRRSFPTAAIREVLPTDRATYVSTVDGTVLALR